jgi:hypothetical protein
MHSVWQITALLCLLAAMPIVNAETVCENTLECDLDYEWIDLSEASPRCRQCSFGPCGPGEVSAEL